MKHIHETRSFLVKSGIFGMSVYNVLWKSELVCRTCLKNIHSTHAKSWANSSSFDETPQQACRANWAHAVGPRL